MVTDEKSKKRAPKALAFGFGLGIAFGIVIGVVLVSDEIMSFDQETVQTLIILGIGMALGVVAFGIVGRFSRGSDTR